MYKGALRAGKKGSSSLGEVHGSLARAGKVRGQTPKSDQKKNPRGRAHKRLCSTTTDSSLPELRADFASKMDTCLPDPPHPVSIPRSKKRNRSPDYTFPSALPDAEKNHRRAEIALECYNEQKGTNYELDRVLGFYKENGKHERAIPNGNWFHCNFEAKQPNGKSCRLFFAELHGHARPFQFNTEIWNVKCTVTVGCKFCLNVVHPTRGFRQRRQKSKFSKVKPGDSGLLGLRFRSPDSPSSYESLSDYDNKELTAECLQVMILALEYYNKENDTNYEFVDAFRSYDFLRDGWWNHCNFWAKLPDSDIPSKLFAAEALLTDPKARTWKFTACVILDLKNENYKSCCYSA